MKKVSIILCLLMLSVAFNGFSQAPAPSDFFVGKWEISFGNSPSGEPNPPLPIDLIRKEGKLTVKLDPDVSDIFKVINPRVKEESTAKLVILFDSSDNERHEKQFRDVPMELIKVDDDNLKVNFMGVNRSAKRIK